ncbi:hypothetical protein U1701_17815 [Sphingomonas sp. PB2P19]|uniref:hypothetical protein n=1 Tax=Sphingomonas rhamnosi TaxID=3096156 RepID=UPI002FCAAE18
MAYSQDEVLEAFDRALRAAARVDRPVHDPDDPWVPHRFDWLEDVHGWMTPVGEGVWVPAALLRRSMMLDCLLSNEELQSPALSLARWPDLEAMIADIDWSAIAPATPEPSPPEWVPPDGASPQRVQAGRTAIANNALSGIYPSWFGLEVLGLWARQVVGIGEAVAMLRRRQTEDKPAALHQILPRGSPAMAEARAWMRRHEADVTMLRLADMELHPVGTDQSGSSI